MGAFVLFKSSERFDKKSVKQTFTDKGFAHPKIFKLNSLTLWLYPKQLLHESNYVYSQKGNAVYSVGTIVYRGNDYRSSLKFLLEDFELGRIEYDRIIGAFCLIFCHDDRIYILTDIGNIYRIYSNANNTLLSSSFLAMISAQIEKLGLARQVILEQLTVGYSSGYETLFKGIFLADSSFKKKVKSRHYEFIQPKEAMQNDNALLTKKFDECVDMQLSVLQTYYESIKLAAMQYGVDMGLSGGYDSRLNLLLADSFRQRITAHTHFSKEHSEEKRIAEILANTAEIPMTAFPVSLPAQKTEDEIAKNLEDSLLFFDGCTNRTMGTFNDVHTREYRIRVLGQNGLGLNGLGGELYRNHDHTYSGKVDLYEWVKYHVIGPHSIAAFANKNDAQELVESVVGKYAKILGIRQTKEVPFRAVRQCYAEILLPYSSGVKNNAENQLSFFLMPFTEFRIRTMALSCTPHIGVNGSFEAAMLMRLDSRIAGLPSSYGFRFDRKPLSHLFKSAIRCYLPDKAKNIFGGLKVKHFSHNHKDYATDLQTHPLIRHCIEVLHDTRLPINLRMLFQSKAHFETSMSIGYLLSRFSDKISIEN